MLRIRTASTSTCSVAFLCILFIYSIMHVCSTVSLCRCQHSKQYPYVHVRTLYPVLLLREVSVGSDLHEGSKKRMAGGDPMRRGACNVDLCARSATVQNSVLPVHIAIWALEQSQSEDWSRLRRSRCQARPSPAGSGIS